MAANRRMITGEVWEDDFFTSLSIFERLLWIGIITGCADDQGRLQDNAVLIRSKVFPMDDVAIQQVEDALIRFAEASKIVRYIEGGKRLIQIANWWKHQTPRWAGHSNYPPPPRWLDRERYHSAGNKIITLNWDVQGGYIADSIDGNTNNDVNDDVNDDDDIKGDDDNHGADAPPPQNGTTKKSKTKGNEIPQELLITATHGGRILYALLEVEFSTNGRRTPKKFPSMACRDKFINECEKRLNDKLKEAITRAMQKGIMDIPGIVDFTAKYGLSNGKGNGNSATAASLGYTRAGSQ